MRRKTLFKNFLQIQAQQQIDSLVNSTKYLGTNTNSLQTLSKIEEEELLSNSFNENSTTLVPKPDIDNTYRKSNYKPVSSTQNL